MGCNGWSSCWGPAENLAYDFFCLGLAHDDTWWMCKYEKEWLFVVLQWTWCLGFLHQRWDPLNESEKSTIFIKQNEEDWFIRFQARHQLFYVNKSQTLLCTTARSRYCSFILIIARFIHSGRSFHIECWISFWSWRDLLMQQLRVVRVSYIMLSLQFQPIIMFDDMHCSNFRHLHVHVA